MLYIHAHGGTYPLGKDELLVGRKVLPPYAPVCAAKGLVTLAIDSWCFGERKHQEDGRNGELDAFKLMLWKGQVLWGMMVYDSLRAVDYLVSRPEVDAGRIATIGLSMGSTMAWWTAALDERIKVTVDICCLTDFHTLIQARGLDGHGIYYFVPRLLKDFTTARINALIAPRAHLSLAGNYDLLTPPQGLEIIDTELQAAYAKAGAPDAWKLLRYEIGHFETAQMRKEIMEFLKTWL
ncbi:MAG TPA: acetylxylan esterase [Planctomycetota bacterium]|nr:acetylxylan esterase [Planctomycetota bacterium]